MLKRNEGPRRTTEGRRLVVFVGTLLLLGACVQIGGIDDPHPKAVEEVDREWANWPMPNPPGLGLPNPASYTIDTGKGLVTDNVTNLMWQRDIDAESFIWADASPYCDNLVYGSFSDWRLPTAIELTSIIDFTKENPGPYIDIDAFPNTQGDDFWTSEPEIGPRSNSFAWYVGFSHGNTQRAIMTNTYRVRCVR